MLRHFFMFLRVSLLFLLVIHTSCKEKTTQNTHNQPQRAKHTSAQQEGKRIKERYNKPFDKYHASPKTESQPSASRASENAIQQDHIPQKAINVLAYVRQNGQAQAGYVGGRRFGNFEGHLPRQDIEGRRINYQEWDVNPKKQGRNRGTERLVTSSDGRAWYTNDHYNSFTEIK
jgi:ribonuclease T1